MFKVGTPTIELRPIEKCTADKIYIRHRSNNVFNKAQVEVLSYLDSSPPSVVWVAIKPDQIFRSSDTGSKYETLKGAFTHSMANNWEVLGFDDLGELHRFLMDTKFYDQK